MALSTVALCYLPTRLSRGKWVLTLGLVGMACLVRVTAVLFWLTPLTMSLQWISWRERLIVTPLVIISVISFGIVTDSLFTGKLIVSWWNFYVWNIVKGVSEHYGRESVVYHLKTTLPLMINTQAGYFAIGLLRAFKGEKGLLAGFMAVFLLFSSLLLKHKETRFLAPMYPMIVLYCAYGAQQLRVMTLKRAGLIRVLTVFALIGVMVSQAIMAWFYGRVHFNGAYDIIDRLRVKLDADTSAHKSVYFLIENHVTPFQGYLHRSQVPSDFLKCHPRQVDELMPESESRDRDDYSRDPREFVKSKVLGYKYIVLYGKDVHLLNNSAYRECGRSSNSLLAIGSNRHRGDLLIYCLKE